MTYDFYASTRNRNPRKQWFITYPQWPSTDRNAIIQKYSDYDYYIVCKEKHKDLSDHYHLLIRFVETKTKKDLIEFVKRSYPNDWKRIHINSVRNLKAAIEYCKKEDTAYMESGNLTISTRFRKWYNRQFEATFGTTVQEFDRIIKLEIIEKLKRDHGITESTQWIEKNFEKLKKYYLN